MNKDILLCNLIEKCSAAILANVDELMVLDQAIGDGDHGHNMKRGFEAIASAKEELAGRPFGDALKKAGMILVMKVGGASGPLYGSLLMGMGDAVSDVPADNEQLAAMFAAGIDAVKARGKSDAGAKTMLDVLIPVHDAIVNGGDIIAIRGATDASLAATKDMLATKGRAAFLGERAIGHIDPGARSSALLIHAVCDILEER